MVFFIPKSNWFTKDVCTTPTGRSHSFNGLSRLGLGEWPLLAAPRILMDKRNQRVELNVEHQSRDPGRFGTYLSHTRPSWDCQGGLPPQTDPPRTTPGRFSAVRPGSPSGRSGYVDQGLQVERPIPISEFWDRDSDHKTGWFGSSHPVSGVAGHPYPPSSAPPHVTPGTCTILHPCSEEATETPGIKLSGCGLWVKTGGTRVDDGK